MSNQKTTTVQTTNVLVEKKEKADEVARSYGFGSIQDVIRIFINDVAEDRVPLRMSWRGDSLTARELAAVEESLAEYERGEFYELPSGRKFSEFIEELDGQL